MLHSSIIGVTVGIRYSRSFRIPDVSGDIIDDILYGADTPFGTSAFDLVRDSSSREKLLINESTLEFLRINTDDLIFSLKVDGNFDSRIKFMKSSVFAYLQRLFKRYQIQNIRRIGVIYAHKLDRTGKLPKSIKDLTYGGVGNAENASVSFSKKLPAIPGLVKKGVKDYRNVIISLGEMSDGLLANLDYQYYFDPAVQDLRDCKPSEIIEGSLRYLSDDFYSWLTKYEGE